MRRRYRPLLELGRGGMAKVFLAESLASGVRKLVVLKILNADLAADPAMRLAFRREAELSAQLNHPNTVQVFEVVEYSGIPVMVMEYLDGVSLSRIAQQVKIPLRIHLHVLNQVLVGLHHFHELRDLEGNDLHAVHRDVSPQNVVVLHDGPVKVVDFGIAKANSAANDQHTRAGLIKGKIHYMPAEQLLGEAAIDRRADIFAVGVMLWEAIAGKRMWEGQSDGRIVRKLTQGDLPRIREAVPDVSEDLEQIVERALAFDPEQRYATAHDMQHDLEHALVKEGGYVRMREVTDFMRTNFGDRRQFQQRAVERALRNPAVSLSGVMECVTPTDLHRSSLSGAMEIHGIGTLDSLSNLSPVSTGAASAGSSDVSLSVSSIKDSPSIQTLRSPRRWPWAIGLVLGGLAAGGTWLSLRAPAPVPSASAPVPDTVRLRVSAAPADAQIFLDGQPLGAGKIDRTIPKREVSAALVVRAEGHVEDTRSVRLDRDLTIDVALHPTAAAVAPNAVPAAPAPVTDVQDEPAARKSKSRSLAAARSATTPAVRSTAASPSAPATAASPPATANCTPPYRLSADGVKTFKPECF